MYWLISWVKDQRRQESWDSHYGIVVWRENLGRNLQNWKQMFFFLNIDSWCITTILHLRGKEGCLSGLIFNFSSTERKEIMSKEPGERLSDIRMTHYNELTLIILWLYQKKKCFFIISICCPKVSLQAEFIFKHFSVCSSNSAGLATPVNSVISQQEQFIFVGVCSIRVSLPPLLLCSPCLCLSEFSYVLMHYESISFAFT